MKNFVKGFLVATLIFAVTSTGFAASKLQTIEVGLNPATIQVMGEVLDVDHFIYNGTTYVPVRAISEMLGVEVDWDGENKVIDLYEIRPREFSLLTLAGIPIIEGRERNEEYDKALAKIQDDLVSLLEDLERINLVYDSIDLDTFIELQDRRTSIENRLYQETFDVNYRTPIFTALEVLDNIELALIRSFNGEDPGKIRHNLNKANEKVEYLLFLGF